MKASAILVFVIVFAAFAQWSSDPGVNLPVYPGSAEQTTPLIALGTDGDSFISWAESNGSGWDMHLQRLDLLGNAMWGSGGIVVSEGFSNGEIDLYDLVTDPSGAAILTLNTQLGSECNVHAYRVSQNGNMLWGADGILLSDTTITDAVGIFSNAAATASGDIIVSWTVIIEPDTAWTVMQRIAPDGSLLWGDGVEVGADSTGLYCWEATLCPTTDDGNIIIYTISKHDAWNKRIYAMKYDSSGNTVWPNPAVISDSKRILQQCIQPPAYPDGSGGLYIAWEEYDSVGLITSMVQHITSGGALAMNDGGVPVSTLPQQHHSEPWLAVTDDGENVYIFWREMNKLETHNGLNGQRMDSNGNRLWTDNGITYIPLQEKGVGNISVQTNGYDAAVFYIEEIVLGGTDIAYSMLVDNSGAYLWPSDKIEISSASCHRGYFHSTPLCWGQQWVTAWSDDRGSDDYVYAQNIKLDGTLGTGGLGIGEQALPNPAVTLGAATPNPFRSTATVPFSLMNSSFVTLGLYDTCGRVVSLVTDGFYTAGNHTVDIDTENIPSGVYILRLDAMGETVSRTCVLLR